MKRENDPTTADGSFSYLDLYARATKALLAKSTDRLFMLRIREQAGQSAVLLSHGGVMISGDLEHVTREHAWTYKPRDVVKYGRFTVGNRHFGVNSRDSSPCSLGNPQQQHTALVTSSTALHLTVSAPDFTRHYDLFYPERLGLGERLHSTIYNVDTSQQQYQTPLGWPEEQPVLYRVYNGDSYEPVLDLDKEPNIARIYATLGNQE